MARPHKRLALTLGLAVLVPAALFAALWFYWSASYVPSKVVDFHPISFQAKAEAGFFYSVGDDLKFGDEIANQSPTLMHGKVENFLVSPDNEKIAVVADGKLVVVNREPPMTMQVARVDSIFREPKPNGQQFFRDFEFQWSRNSKELYLVKDEYHETKGAQLFSDKAELWKYQIRTRDLELVLKPFPAGSYFLGLKSGIYFSVPTETGDLQLRCFDGKHLSYIRVPYGQSIPVERLTSSFVESPFFSFDRFDFGEVWRRAEGLAMVQDQGNGLERLEIRNTPYLALTRGTGFKGSYYCADSSGSVFLPGGRYLLLNLYCANYEGQLLIDAHTGKYERLPKDSRVYLTANTDTYPHYRITVNGIKVL